MRPRIAVPVLLIVVAGCSLSAAPTAAPSGTPVAVQPSAPMATPASASLTARPTASPAPTVPPGLTAWPTTNDVELSGTYWSSPPFTVPFQIAISEKGWFSGHTHAEFIDLQRFDGITPYQFPNRMLGFADPAHIQSGSGSVAVGGLTPAAALDLLADRSSLRTSNGASVALFGIAGERVDLHSPTNNNPLFGGAGGNFGLGPELDVRLVLLPRDGRFFVVAVLAAPGDVDAAWEQALPILETVRFEP